ncbi:MAG: metallophosphoesterase [Campylobacterota bacterium]|nr:metallophosphoesterase [Campylobacterota bacterium]
MCKGYLFAYHSGGKKIKKTLIILSLAAAFLGIGNPLYAKVDLLTAGIPGAYANLKYERGKLVAEINATTSYHLKDETPKYTLDMVRGNPVGNETGFTFTFKDESGQPKFSGGKVFYALADLNEKYPRAKWKREAGIGKDGVANVKLIGKLQGKYDFIDWEKCGKGALYYRVADASGYIVYEGKFFFIGKGPFSVDRGSIIEGPFVNKMTHNSATISFETMYKRQGRVKIDGAGEFASGVGTHHEIEIGGLSPDTEYKYSVEAGGVHRESYAFKTAPEPGSRKPFVFAYASDSRSGIASGEREIAGVNAYMMRRIGALMAAKNAVFLQFTGDEIDGYRNAPPRQELEYVNWKRAMLPFASRIPVNASMGNHEALLYTFEDGSKYGLQADRFPYATESAEALFAKAFVNPLNGPESEDGAFYDPDPHKIDFPSYKENVFYYTYDNIAMVSLNSNYWYSPSVQRGKNFIGGNPHGYLMDNQIAWLKETLKKLDADKNIDFIFVTHHTPVFPNGGHVKDDMFYHGKNHIRPYIADANGLVKPHPKGIIERRDAYWKILMESKKVVAVLTGDEHNYARLEVKPGMPIYGEYKPRNKLEITRTIYQIHNGAAGAPYYGKEETPWNNDVEKGKSANGKYLKNFTTENAVVFFHVHGKKLEIEVINPDTLNRIE